ncbi:hypothetical protein [Butyrivibrio sp. LB2008]|uniref:hypothetical protein n=1 Tax=Butyrivibrio sp. LB2008 TaxID=1408305 RepID=UPI00047B2637|nr:hypothetical protein [Butyrivibrio sp. LB2008]
MKREVFLEKIKEMGIKPESLGIYFDEICRVPYARGIYCDNGDWVIYSIDEITNVHEEYRGEEENAFDILFEKLFVRLAEDKYINHSITDDIVKTPRTVIFDYFRKKYLMEDEELNEAWNYLLQNFVVLNNLKYYVVHDSFVPEEDACVFEGYTAKRIYEGTYLNELEAHKYLVDLRLNPKQALNKLESMLRINKEPGNQSTEIVVRAEKIEKENVKEKAEEKSKKVETRYYKFDNSDGGMRATREYQYDDSVGDMKLTLFKLEYLNCLGIWEEDCTLLRKFVGGDTDFDEISEAEADKLVENMRNRYGHNSRKGGLWCNIKNLFCKSK